MHVLLRSSDGLIPVWVDKPSMDVFVHRKDHSARTERFLLFGIMGDGRLVYVPAVVPSAHLHTEDAPPS